MRRLAVPPPERAKPAPGGKPTEPLARPKEGRSWHADTPFETVQTPEGVLLKKEAEARVQAQAQAARPADASAARKTVPAVNVAWADLNAAVQAGWIRPEAAHALWARWLARKPLTHIEDDGAPVQPLPPLPPLATARGPVAAQTPAEDLATGSAATPALDAAPIPTPPPPTERSAHTVEPPAEAPEPGARASSSDSGSQQTPESPETPGRSDESAAVSDKPDTGVEPLADKPDQTAPPAPAADAPSSAPDVLDVDVPEPHRHGRHHCGQQRQDDLTHHPARCCLGRLLRLFRQGLDHIRHLDDGRRLGSALRRTARVGILQGFEHLHVQHVWRGRGGVGSRRRRCRLIGLVGQGLHA
ncbi:MAG: hypothetical protein ACKOD9_17320, partial [Rubrivivax sp.]